MPEAAPHTADTQLNPPLSGEPQERSLPPLPEGYYYDPEPDITDKAELADLLTKVGIYEGGITTQEIEAHDTYLEQHGVQHRGIGVRDENKALVGYGLVMHIGNYAELSDLGVDPDHRGRGIGKAIIDASLQLVADQQIENVYIEEVLPTNNLRTYYTDHGFRQTQDGHMLRGTDPIDIDHALEHILSSWGVSHSSL